jgi:CheY-like chemotaxis protein
MDGFETCRRIRRESGLRHVPILFLTAYPFAENIQKALSVGGNDFVAKPFDIDILVSRVAALTAAGARHNPPTPKAARV